MKVSRFERIMQKLEARTEKVSSKIADDLKNVKPFDMRPMTSQERIQKYMALDENVKNALRQDLPGWAENEQEIQKLMGEQYGL